MQPAEFLPEISDFSGVSARVLTGVDAYVFPAIYETPTAAQGYRNSNYRAWDESVITDTPEARARENHKEAEKRRRERINSHLNSLRTLLPCNPKTDKASLLGRVIQRVKELKQETSDITELENFPSEADEITVLPTDENSDNDGQIVIRASLCCEDRPDLVKDLIQTLRSLKLNPLRAEMASFGGRIRNVIIVAVDNNHRSGEIVRFLKEALRTLAQHPNRVDRTKRQCIRS